MTTVTQIDTGKVTGRRTLRFNSVEDAVRDFDALLAVDKSGRLNRLGNWTLGQTFGHLATWAEFPYDGYPPDMRPPWFVKVLMRPLKKKLLTGMPAGKRIPGIKDGTKGTEVMETQAGYERVKKAFLRLQAKDPGIPNPVFGPMTHAEWIAMNLRHAELHLSFLVPS